MLLRPHILRLVTRTDGGLDYDGVPLADAESTEDFPCHIVQGGASSQVRYEDGVALDSSFTVYLDVDCRKFVKGEEVRLIGLDGEIDNDKIFKVIDFHRYQIVAKLWV